MSRYSILAALAWLGAGVLAGGLTGCAIMGRSYVDHALPPEQVARIRPGMNRVEVTEILGAPKEIIFSNKEHDPLREHAYIYEYTSQAATGIFFLVVNFGRLDAKSDRVVVFLDESGNVSHVGASLHADESSFGFPFGK